MVVFVEVWLGLRGWIGRVVVVWGFEGASLADVLLSFGGVILMRMI